MCGGKALRIKPHFAGGIYMFARCVKTKRDKIEEKAPTHCTRTRTKIRKRNQKQFVQKIKRLTNEFCLIKFVVQKLA